MTHETAAPVYTSVTLASETCCKCGIAFGMPDYFIRQKRRDATLFSCPNGHEQHYTESEADKLRKQLEAEKLRSTAERERAERLDRQLSANRGLLTKQRKRAQAGVCPCCNRTFVAMGRHMKTKHPGYSAQEIG